MIRAMRKNKAELGGGSGGCFGRGGQGSLFLGRDLMLGDPEQKDSRRKERLWQGVAWVPEEQQERGRAAGEGQTRAFYKMTLGSIGLLEDSEQRTGCEVIFFFLRSLWRRRSQRHAKEEAEGQFGRSFGSSRGWDSGGLPEGDNAGLVRS